MKVLCADLAVAIARRPRLCRLLSITTMSLELSFPLVIFFPLSHWVLVPAALAFHLGTRVAMRIDYLRFLGPAYLAFVAPLLWQIAQGAGLHLR